MSWVAAAVGGASLIGGGIQAILGGGKEKRANNAIQNLATPTYAGNKSLLDYYNTAMQRYNVNPYQTAQYQAGIQQGQRGTAAGINALQQGSPSSAIGGISRLIALQNQNALQQGIGAEQEQNQRFGQLGQAASMKAADDRYGFQINQLMPYQKQLDLLTAKAQGGAQTLNAGLSNMFNGLGTAAAGIFTNRPKTNTLNLGGYNGGNNSLNNLNGGGIGGNYSTLQGGNPFGNSNIFDYSNTYGE